MSENIEDPTLRKWNENYPFLIGLPLYRIYNNFSTYYNIRKNENAICKSSIASNILHSNDIISVCQKTQKILNNIKSIATSLKLANSNKLYEYLSYFLYEKIRKFTTNNNFKELYQALNDIKECDQLNGENCNIINFHNNNEEFDNKKELFFRNEIIQVIKDKYDIYFADEESFYKTYMNESAHLYNQVISANYCKYDQYYKKLLENFSYNFEETKIFLTSIDISATCTALNTKPSCETEVRVTELLQTGVEDSQSHLQNEAIAGSFGIDTLSSSTSNNGKGKTVGIISGMMFGILLLFLLFCKFTPLGTLLNHKIWKITNKFNRDYNTDDLTLDNLENEKMDLYNSTYKIQYHSLQYS
ncbi:PIR Superfamily Protein [Plasmodium ovale wallikeri]|uniref:PIR Superfamily Protein n=2 Tax=Plasmodium ovale TaxID=36330 RepID=A0A1A9A6E9_PLAOA|nr:PIR Superfamily Protein [Plasmodium ovale wallikeri]SBT55537.1 PIR Superfamily Protein [Plasmodium ovale wallikeri]SBT74552.1 PIR protein [Plasmodium ovale]